MAWDLLDDSKWKTRGLICSKWTHCVTCKQYHIIIEMAESSLFGWFLRNNMCLIKLALHVLKSLILVHLLCIIISFQRYFEGENMCVFLLCFNFVPKFNMHEYSLVFYMYEIFEENFISLSKKDLKNIISRRFVYTNYE